MGYNCVKIKMKKALRLALMAALVILMCLPSCTKPEKQIVGKWKIVYAKIDGFKDEEAEGELWVFKDNGRFRGYLGLDDDDEEEEYCNWLIDGSELVLKGGDLEYIENEGVENVVLYLDIEQLDKENLIVSGKVRYEDIDDGNHGSFNVSYELERN